MLLLTSLLFLSVHVKCVSFMSKSTSCRTSCTDLAHVDIEVFAEHDIIHELEERFHYLARQVFLQHLWNGVLQHLLVAKLIGKDMITSTETNIYMVCND